MSWLQHDVLGLLQLVSLVILSIVLTMMAFLFFTLSSSSVNFTPEASHILVIKEGNNKVTDFYFFVA